MKYPIGTLLTDKNFDTGDDKVAMRIFQVISYNHYLYEIRTKYSSRFVTELDIDYWFKDAIEAQFNADLKELLK